MAGADTASATCSSAVLANPATLGFMARSNELASVDNNLLGNQRFGWSVVDAGLYATLTGDLGDYLETLAGLDFSLFDSANLQNPESIKKLVELAGVLGNVSDNDTVVVNANLGSIFQAGNFGSGIRMYGQIGGWINELDLLNIGLNMLASEIASEIDDAIREEGFDPVGYQYQTFRDENVQKMRDAFGGSVDDDVIAYLDYKVTEVANEEGLDREQINGAVDALADIIASSGLGTSLTDNTTSITGRAFLAVEVPLSYGYAFNDNFAVGVTARAIFGRVYGTQVWAFNEDNADIVEESLRSSVDRFNVGLDASMMYRIPKWQFALTGYNLNSPTFDGYTQTVDINGTPTSIQVPSVTLDPQLTFGAAWIPTKRFVLATDLELLETDTLLNGYDVQRISFGSEVDLSLVQLRLGTYKNIAEEDIGWVLTGGLGFQLWALSADLGAAVSINDTVTYDGMDLPRTARLHLGVSMDF